MNAPPKCPCANPPGAGKLRPRPRRSLKVPKSDAPKFAAEISETELKLESSKPEQIKLNRHKWIMNKKSEVSNGQDIQIRVVKVDKNLSGFLPETQKKRRRTKALTYKGQIF